MSADDFPDPQAEREAYEHALTVKPRDVDDRPVVATDIDELARRYPSGRRDSEGTQYTRRHEVGAPPAAPSEHAARKACPLVRGCLDYFPDALMAVARVSRIGNEQHHPGAPLHWDFGKSADHADCCARHLIDRGTLDSDGASHSEKAAWRALAMLQTEIEENDPELHARREAQRALSAKGAR